MFGIIDNSIGVHNFKYSHKYPIINSSLGNYTVCALDKKISDCWSEYMPFVTIQNNDLYNVTIDCKTNITCAENFINVPYIIGYFSSDQFIITNYMEPINGIVLLLTMSCVGFVLFLIIFLLCFHKMTRIKKNPYIPVSENENELL